ncbi:alpha/beta fold hydrolase [Mucilaginibacter conchicola]|nr:alpha/beta hydrolase [Mucilaginibacter conchicola]
MNLKRVFIITLFIAFVSCQNKKSGNALPPVNNKGVNIAYTDSSEGDTTLLFVHGWCINKSYWQDQVKYFSKNYRVITIDLPGYGQSGKNRTEFDSKAYAGDVKAVVNQLKLSNVILIGHSMAGDIVLKAALENQKVIGIIGIDNFKSVGVAPANPAQAKKEFAEAIALMKKNFKAVALKYFNEQLFYKTTSEAIKKRIINDVTHADTVIAVKNMEDDWPDEAVLLKQLNKKLYLLNSDYDPTNESGLKAKHLPYDLTYIHATGHFPMIEKPDEFNKLLSGILKRFK